MSGDDLVGPDDAPKAPCPSCGEAILAAAKKCRFCGVWLDEAARERVRRLEAPKGDVPPALKVWGALLMLGAAALGAFALIEAVTVATTPLGSGPGVAAGFALWALVFLVLGRLGLGLFRGQRAAVIGMGLLGALLLIPVIVMLVDASPDGALVWLGFDLVLCGVPVGTGAAAWRRLT